MLFSRKSIYVCTFVKVQYMYSVYMYAGWEARMRKCKYVFAHMQNTTWSKCK